MKERFRALFTLRNIGGADSIQAIADCFQDDSALLKHELAYCLGQMQDTKAIPVLVKGQRTQKLIPMLRKTGDPISKQDDVQDNVKSS